MARGSTSHPNRPLGPGPFPPRLGGDPGRKGSTGSSQLSPPTCFQQAREMKRGKIKKGLNKEKEEEVRKKEKEKKGKEK